MQHYSVFYHYTDPNFFEHTRHFKIFKANTPEQAIYKAKREMQRALKLPENDLWQVDVQVCIKGRHVNQYATLEAARIGRMVRERHGDAVSA